MSEPNLWALPAARAREAFEAARWQDDVNGWEAAMAAAYPTMRDEYVRLSLERDDARMQLAVLEAALQMELDTREGLEAELATARKVLRNVHAALRCGNPAFATAVITSHGFGVES